MAEGRIRQVPDDLYMKFKLPCVKKKISMNKMLIRLMQGAVEKAEREEKKKK